MTAIYLDAVTRTDSNGRKYIATSGANTVFSSLYLHWMDEGVSVVLLTSDSEWPKEKVSAEIVREIAATLPRLSKRKGVSAETSPRAIRASKVICFAPHLPKGLGRVLPEQKQLARSRRMMSIGRVNSPYTTGPRLRIGESLLVHATPGDIAVQIALCRIGPNCGPALRQAVLFSQKHVFVGKLLEQ